jgi:hypothetical protein
MIFITLTNTISAVPQKKIIHRIPINRAGSPRKEIQVNVGHSFLATSTIPEHPKRKKKNDPDIRRTRLGKPEGYIIFPILTVKYATIIASKTGPRKRTNVLLSFIQFISFLTINLLKIIH